MRHKQSLEPNYFEELFTRTPDPWGFETSTYETEKYDHTIASLAGRRYGRGFEIGCANGVLTRRLGDLCDTLLAIDVSPTVLSAARARCADKSGVYFEQMVFPKVTPQRRNFDLVVISEVAYYWDDGDLPVAAQWLENSLANDGIIILVHWTGETDYPQTADDAVEKLRFHLRDVTSIVKAVRYAEYRLDLWRRGYECQCFNDSQKPRGSLGSIDRRFEA